jgi:hypothetical protein
MNKQTFSMETGDYISSCPDKYRSIRKTVIIESIHNGVDSKKAFVRQMSFVQVSHSGGEDACGPGRNGMSLRQSPIVSCYK